MKLWSMMLRKDKVKQQSSRLGTASRGQASFATILLSSYYDSSHRQREHEPLTWKLDLVICWGTVLRHATSSLLRWTVSEVSACRMYQCRCRCHMKRSAQCVTRRSIHKVFISFG